MNNHLKSKNSPNHPKEERSLLETPHRQERQRHRCPSCQQMSYLMCYGCCFEFACQICYSTQHFTQCKRKFNHHPINLNDLAIEQQAKSKRNGRKSRHLEKCQRCFESCENNEYCIRCKVVLCGKCLKETHFAGKFSQHTRVKHGQSPTKMKKMETFTTQTDQIQDNTMKKSTKFNIQSSEQGPKAKERTSKLYSTPSQKKGKSIAKATNQNQQNVGLIGSIKQKPISNQINFFNHAPSLSQLAQNSWQKCVRHSKLRTILTQSFDIVCQECYQQTKSSVSKIKNVDILHWISGMNNQSVKLNVQSSLNQCILKMKELQVQFSRHKQHLLEQFTKKQQMLAEKYKNNLFNLQKWQNTYKSSISNIIDICQSSLKLKEIEQNQALASTDKSIKELQNILNLKHLLALQQISQCKKQYYIQEQQYQFKINEISNECFEEIVKTFNFIRKRVDNQNQMNNSTHQKSLSKMNQSNHLRQSRMSNSSIRTDRKTIVRDESFQKSSYCELSNSNNLLKRSISKEVKQDLGKDISQRILFQNSSGLKSQKRSLGNNNIKKLDNKHIKNNQYFFESVQDSNQKSKVNSRKQPIELTNYCFKEVKYVDLQNFLTEKLDRIYDQKNSMTENLKIDERKSNLFKSDMEISTQLIDLCQQQGKNTPITDSRMNYSITMVSHNQSNVSKMTTQATNSINNSVHNINKNKRKSDYMEMRDRLRKPNVMHKVGK